jgi:hypothetical protein
LGKTPDYDALELEMVKAVAHANLTWARIENSMASLLEWLTGYSSDSTALHIYFVPSNTETRFKIVNAVAQIKWQDYTQHNLIGEWRILFAALNKAKDTRNKIAHGEIRVSSKRQRGTVRWQARLTALSYDLNRRRKEEMPRQWSGLSVSDVMATGTLFFALALRIEEMIGYWRNQTTGQHTTLPEIFARIVDRRLATAPQPSGQKTPKPEAPPEASPRLLWRRRSALIRLLVRRAIQLKEFGPSCHARRLSHVAPRLSSR